MDLHDIKLLMRHGLEFFDQGRSDIQDDWYYFIHIPKTAGTSFRYALFEEFRASEIYPNNLDFYLRQRGRYLSWHELNLRKDDLFPDTKRMLVGHFHLGPLSNSFRETSPKTMCFLRDPVDRVASSISYHREPGRRYHGMDFDKILEEFGEFEGTMQARHLGYRAKSNNLEQVYESLTRLDAIGLTEEYARSICLFNQTFGWSMSVGARKNQADSRRPALTEGHLDAIAACCRVDLEVYSRARTMFERLWTSIDQTDDSKSLS